MGFFYTDEGLCPKRLYIFLMFIDTFKSFSLTFYCFYSVTHHFSTFHCVHQICSINACHVLYLFSFIYNCNLDSIHLTLLHSAQITVECQHCKQLQFIDGRNIWDSLCDTQRINVCHFYYFKKLCRMDFKARQPLLLNLYLYKTVFEVWM